ncbi:MAG: DNA cytosine methyltransferase [Chitinophagaceae bacterium]|nr:DNA cytosine methyltransferase [Chitinophagaceae bacterium]
MSSKQIPIIDLFAGPGGLGEGFTSVVNDKNERFFKIVLSIERDEFAHKTLTLRSFLRQFPVNQFPPEYYQFVRGEIKEVEDLYKLYPEQANAAKYEAWRFSLGDQKDHEQIDKRIRESRKGERNFLLIGGPPCQAYSLVGRARRQEKEGLNKEDERVYLFREYYRILAKHQPAVFIMENVKGLLSSKVENESIFKELLNDLRNPVESYRKLHGENKIPKSKYGYKIFSLVKRPNKKNFFTEEFRPSDFIIRAEKYGIPQTRHRVILLGIREDITLEPNILIPAEKQISVQDVLAGLPALRSGLSKEKDGKQEWKAALESLRSPGLKKQIDEVVWNKMMQVIDNISIPRKDRGNLYVDFDASVNYRPEWYLDKMLKGVANHEARGHMRNDLWRYLFVSCFGKIKGRSPKLEDFPSLLLPNHKNVKTGDFVKRFMVQLPGEPCKTITSHISKDGHAYIYADPLQCRSFTVREAARIQTFPDNYFFCGPRTEQYKQVGNAVPPLLAKQIASIISKIFR